MLRPHPGLLAAALISIVSPAVADSPVPANACTVEAGKRVITVPYPEGYVRSDGVNKAVDTVVAGFVPATHRMLAYFTSPVDLKALQLGAGSIHRRNFSLQIIKSLEDRNLDARAFTGIRDQIKAELAQVPVHADAEMKRRLAEGTAQVKNQFGTGADPGLEVTESSFIRYFEDSGSGFGYTMNHVAREKDSENGYIHNRSLTATLMSLVNDRLFVFVANVPFERASDAATAEKGVLAWRDAVVAANIGIVPARSPELSAAPAGPEKEKGTGYTVWILTGAGAVLALAAWMLRKKRAAARVV